MTDSLFGMMVARSIPSSAMVGLATGQYSLHGGVIRWAAGTPLAGQIVCHLLPASSAVGNAAFVGAGIVSVASVATSLLPIVNIGLGIVGAVTGSIAAFNTFKLLAHAKQTMALAEMNLTVSKAGFQSLDHRLDALEAKLDTIKTAVTAIYKLLQIAQRAELRVALENLSQIGMISDAHVQRETLVQAATTLAKIALIYEERLNDAGTLAEAMVCEEYYCIAMLAQARCYAELRELPRARHIITTLHDRWSRFARRIANHYLLGANPEKFLAGDFAKSVSIAELATWLDFANDTTKGYAWIDELRAKSDPWHYVRWSDVQPASRKLLRSLDLDELRYLHETIIFPGVRKLVARNDVLASYGAQYTLMAQHQLTAHEFEAQLGAVRQEDLVDGFLILTVPDPVDAA